MASIPGGLGREQSSETRYRAVGKDAGRGKFREMTWQLAAQGLLYPADTYA